MVAIMIGCLPTQALAFLAIFVYATHATQAIEAIAIEWKPGLTDSGRCLQKWENIIAFRPFWKLFAEVKQKQTRTPYLLCNVIVQLWSSLIRREQLCREAPLHFDPGCSGCAGWLAVYRWSDDNSIWPAHCRTSWEGLPGEETDFWLERPKPGKTQRRVCFVDLPAQQWKTIHRLKNSAWFAFNSAFLLSTF